MTTEPKYGEWLPIESAPNDGTLVLAAIEKPGYSGQAIARQIGGQWEHEDGALFGGWTHWMPRPQPPTKDSP
jgi:hypothetical protein